MIKQKDYPNWDDGMSLSVTRSQVLADAALALRQCGIESAALDAGVLLAHRLGLTREMLLLHQDKQMNHQEINDFNSLISRRARHEPVAYITGQKEFWSLDFYVTRDTLIPRPDSETLVRAALKRLRNNSRNQAQGRPKPVTLLDIGTGTGCLLIALLKELPEASGVGGDNSEPALQVAEKNAKRNGVQERARFVKSHWCNAIQGTFDLIVSNPPYITEDAMASLMADVLNYEPRTALASGDGFAAYRELVPQIALKLNPQGYVLLEVGAGQAGEVERLLEAQGLSVEPVEKDLAGTARCVVARKH